MIDPQGIYGAVLVSSLKLALLGSSILTFRYFWRRGALGFDEEPKYLMLLSDQEREDNHE
jgi:hypothetical protein